MQLFSCQLSHDIDKKLYLISKLIKIGLWSKEKISLNMLDTSRVISCLKKEWFHIKFANGFFFSIDGILLEIVWS